MRVTIATTRGLSPSQFEEAARGGLAGLHKRLHAERAPARARGLIGGDDTVKDGSQLKTEDFAYPTEKEHLFIRYYRPGK